MSAPLPRGTRRAQRSARAWVIVIEKWPPMGGWNWTIYLGGRCADEGFRKTKRDALGAAREAIRSMETARVRARRRAK